MRVYVQVYVTGAHSAIFPNRRFPYRRTHVNGNRRCATPKHSSILMKIWICSSLIKRHQMIDDPTHYIFKLPCFLKHPNTHEHTYTTQTHGQFSDKRTYIGNKVFSDWITARSRNAAARNRRRLVTPHTYYQLN